MIKWEHPSVWSYQNTCGWFSKEIVHITLSLLLSKAVRKLDRRGVSAALLNDFSKALEYNLLDFFNNKLHAHSVDAHIQRLGHAYLGDMKMYWGPCQASLRESFVKIGND